MLRTMLVNSFVTGKYGRTKIQRILHATYAMQGICASAAVDCIKECNSIEECMTFVELNPTPYVCLMANARIRQLSSFGKKSIVVGGHETNE